jgi:hypothetical protein
MPDPDRRTTHRRGAVFSTNASPGNAMTMDRRANADRRRAPRRRSDLQTIAQYAQRVAGEEMLLDVVFDGVDGLQLIAAFDCGCVGIEPVGNGKRFVRVEPCGEHVESPVAVDRRRGR